MSLIQFVLLFKSSPLNRTSIETCHVCAADNPLYQSWSVCTETRTLHKRPHLAGLTVLILHQRQKVSMLLQNLDYPLLLNTPANTAKEFSASIT